MAIQTSIEGADKLIIPGVGAFGKAMESLTEVADDIREFAQTGKPLLGICLGQQLLLDQSEEHGLNQGLGLIPGVVKYFPQLPGLKVPQMGWNRLEPVPGAFTEGTSPTDEVYFVHSLYTDLSDPADAAAWTTYGIRFASAVQHDNIWGMQFHPEKSGAVGLSLLEKFLICS